MTHVLGGAQRIVAGVGGVGPWGLGVRTGIKIERRTFNVELSTSNEAAVRREGRAGDSAEMISIGGSIYRRWRGDGLGARFPFYPFLPINGGCFTEYCFFLCKRLTSIGLSDYPSVILRGKWGNRWVNGCSAGDAAAAWIGRVEIVGDKVVGGQQTQLMGELWKAQGYSGSG